MRIEPGTYIAAAGRLALASLAVLAGCSGPGHGTARAPAGPLTVYVSVPRHGVESSAGQSVAAGVRLALSDAQGRAGNRDVRLVQLDDSKPEGFTWDPAAVEANAKRAAADPTTIAYIGELDEGGSAVSVPVTNDAGFLQVSPLDGLTSLTRDQPGAAPGTGPARYYPSGKRTFLRLAPRDYLQASELVDWAGERGATRLAIVQDDEVFGRVLAQQVEFAAERAHMQVTDVLEPHDDPAGFPDFALKIAMKRPDAVVYTGIGSPTAGQLLSAIGRALPSAQLYGSSALVSAVPAPASLPEIELLSPLLPVSEYGPRARLLLKRLPPGPSPVSGAEALYGYESMRVVLDAINAAGPDPGDRLTVVRAALGVRSRRSVIGNYGVLASGDVTSERFGAYRRSATALRFLGTRGTPP